MMRKLHTFIIINYIQYACVKKCLHHVDGTSINHFSFPIVNSQSELISGKQHCSPALNFRKRTLNDAYPKHVAIAWHSLLTSL